MREERTFETAVTLTVLFVSTKIFSSINVAIHAVGKKIQLSTRVKEAK